LDNNSYAGGGGQLFLWWTTLNEPGRTSSSVLCRLARLSSSTSERYARYLLLWCWVRCWTVRQRWVGMVGGPDRYGRPAYAPIALGLPASTFLLLRAPYARRHLYYLATFLCCSHSIAFFAVELPSPVLPCLPYYLAFALRGSNIVSVGCPSCLPPDCMT